MKGDYKMVSEQVKRWIKTWKGKEYYKDWIVQAEENDRFLDDYFDKRKKGDYYELEKRKK